MKPIHTLTVNGEVYDLQNRDFRHIATVTNDTGEDVNPIAVTQDSEGNPFSCKEFFIFATIPPAKGNQIYIGEEMYRWIIFSSVGKSTAATRTLAAELKHTGDGWWRGSILGLDNMTSQFSCTNGGNLYSNFRSNNQMGERLESIVFYGGGAGFPHGTVIEIYGK